MYITNVSKRYPCFGYTPTTNSVSFYGVEGVTLPLTGDIELISESDDLVLAVQNCGDYARQAITDGVLLLTNEPEPPAPSAEEILQSARKEALKRIEGYCSKAIFGGCMVTCSTARGSKHYSFPDEAQRAIVLMQQSAAGGETKFSYKADDEEYNPYTADEVNVLFKTLGGWITSNTKYKETLEKWILQETNTVVLQTIQYGSRPPSTLLTALTDYLTGLGIDVTALAALLTQ